MHCNHHAVLGYERERHLLERTGLDVEVLNSGCCGLAVWFGFDADHYVVARQCAERVLLPAVRAAAPDSLIIADGFSCREQIAQSSSRHARHLAEVLRPRPAI